MRPTKAAINKGDTEEGVVAVGVPVLAYDRTVLAAVSLAFPASRFNRTMLEGVIMPLREVTSALGSELVMT